MNTCNILFTSVGRRVSLIRHFHRALKELQLDGKIFGADVSDRSPAFHITEKSFLVPRIGSADYIPCLLTICSQEQVKMVIPLIDTDLYVLAENRQRFHDIGTQVIISDTEVIRIGMYKTETHQFFKKYGIDTPELFSCENKEKIKYNLPLIVKPNDGSASKMVFRAENEEQFQFFARYVPNAIVQEFVAGEEYTLDVFADLSGKVRCVVPRLRIEVREGEVSKGIIIKNSALIHLGKKVCECLPGAKGCITLQCIRDTTGKIQMIEINPRFGGGAPLSIEAGADFPKWILQMLIGQEIGDVADAYKDGLMMLRYDDAVFIERQGSS
jgi:carbamoyl-phosphate synthase large subunit